MTTKPTVISPEVTGVLIVVRRLTAEVAKALYDRQDDRAEWLKKLTEHAFQDLADMPMGNAPAAAASAFKTDAKVAIGYTLTGVDIAGSD